jgi:predicted Fe-S protein YdhL (DUF1289 family)
MDQDPERQAAERPASPCINVCVLDATGVCAGCLRTLEEIARWSAMSATEQRTLIATLAERRKLRGSSQDPKRSEFDGCRRENQV